jgi:hypothetical protein
VVDMSGSAENDVFHGLIIATDLHLVKILKRTLDTDKGGLNYEEA